MRYKVTIGIPVFRVEKYIRRTIESALAQTYPDVEILVIDDGSDDQSLSVIKSIQQTHPRGSDMRVLEHSQNMGVSETRNHIIDEARGEFLYFMDSDDVIVPDTIALLMRQIENYKLDAAFGSYERIEISGERTVFQYPEMVFSDGDSFANYVYRSYAGFQASSCNFLVRLSLIHTHHLRFYKSDFWEDMVFTLNLATFVERVALLPDITYTYLCRENSLSNSWNRDKIAKERIMQYFEAVNTLKHDNGLLSKRPFYPNRCYIAMMSDIYIICNVIKKGYYIVPPFTDSELHSNLSHPASLLEILSFKKKRIVNLILYLLGRFPAIFSILSIKLYARYKRLI